MANGLLYNAPLFYPSAREWMWDYCIYLGPYTDSKGTNFDLGIHIDIWENGTKHYSAAIVDGDNPGDYFSGELDERCILRRECYVETVRRAKELGLISKK